MDGFYTNAVGNVVVRAPRKCGARAQALAEEVLARHGVALAHIVTKSRRAKIHAARVAVVRALWETGRHSQADIARFLGRHPSSVNLMIHGVKAKPWAERKKAA